MNKTINIPHKKVQPSPQFKPLVAGEGVTLEELNQRITEISAKGGSGGGQRIVVSPDQPEDLKANDFWYEVKEAKLYIALPNDDEPFFLVINPEPIDLENSTITIEGKTYPTINSDPYKGIVRFESSGVLTAELYELLTVEYGFDISPSSIGHYCYIGYPIVYGYFINRGIHSVSFKFGTLNTNVEEYEIETLLLFLLGLDGDSSVSDDYLLVNDNLTLEQLQTGTFTVVNENEDDYSDYLSFEETTTVVDDAFVSLYGEYLYAYKGMYKAKITFSPELPVGGYDAWYEYDGSSSLMFSELSFSILMGIVASDDYDEFLLYMSLDFPFTDLSVALDGTALSSDQFNVYTWDRDMDEATYADQVLSFPTLPRESIGCVFGKFTIDNVPIGSHYVTASNTVNSATVSFTNYGNVLCFTAGQSNSTIGMTHNGTNASTTKPVIYKSTDKENWEEWDYTTITLANEGDKVYMYGENPNGFNRTLSNYSNFTMSGLVAASGSVNALISLGDVSLDGLTCCFSKLFENCTSLTTAPELPATTLALSCYNSMFYGCTSLTTAPELPATTLVSSCYTLMFAYCSSLTTAPELPATTLAGSCYRQMFRDCTSLTIAPELPATTLTSECYNSMFYNCTSLIIAPELPATTLVQSCYESMFALCSSLNRVSLPNIISWDTSKTNAWLMNTASIGTLYCLAACTIPSSNTSGIPTGWTRANL